MNNERVLIVEDEFLIADLLSAMVEDLGLRVCGHAVSADEAVALARHHAPGIVLMDVRLKGQQDGVDAALIIHREVGSRVIFITGSRDPATVTRIRENHPSAILFKPFSFEQLKQAVASIGE